MFKTLFFKECGQILKSITYYVFVACIVLFFVTQIGEFDVLVEPQEGLESYGSKISDDENVIMEQSLKELVKEYDRNSYITYPIGFYKQVILNEEKQEEMEDILISLTGLSIDEIKTRLSQYYEGQKNEMTELGYMIIKEGVELNVKPLDTLTYDEFLSYMNEVNELIGGGSKYSSKSIKDNALKFISII